MRKVLIVFLTAKCLLVQSQKINRKALVQRHNVVVTNADTLSALTVGNGSFAFTVDITGLQTFTKDYERGVPLGTESEWGWHSFIDTAGYKREEALKTYHLNTRDIKYSVQWNSPERNKASANWYRQNPHRLQLGNIGFELIKKNGSRATLHDIKNIKQELDLWTGEIKSRFIVDGTPVYVSTFCDGLKDAIGVKVSSPLIKEGRLKIKLVFPYPTGGWSDVGTNYKNAGKHISVPVISNDDGAVILHQLDTTKYYVGLHWKGKGTIAQQQPHNFIITPNKGKSSLELCVGFNLEKDFSSLPFYASIKNSSEEHWKIFWNSGGAIDFAGSSDKRAFELERRIILSQYLMKVQEAGSYPPQETGLTYNSWFGKPHLEMNWWHAV
ncbi:MAG: hypothetical protein ABIN93_08265, partial [Ginsengibacter sp.]